MTKNTIATKTIVSTIGAILGISGIIHGFFEVLQGNVPTNSLIIQAIGKAHQMWPHGSEEAFSIVPNFLVSGILTITISIFLIIWSIKYIDTKHNAKILGLLFVLLFLFGGGIAGQIMFAPFVLIAATYINKPLLWLAKSPANNIYNLTKIWPFTLTIGSISFLIGLFISITGYLPVKTDPQHILSICWFFVFGGGLVMLLLTIVAGLINDAQVKDNDTH